MLNAARVRFRSLQAKLAGLLTRFRTVPQANPFARADEEIRWFGACDDGRVSGQGTLVWYIEGIESERNEGAFRDGEFHGEVITTYPDGEVIVGHLR